MTPDDQRLEERAALLRDERRPVVGRWLAGNSAQRDKGKLWREALSLIDDLLTTLRERTEALRELQEAARDAIQSAEGEDEEGTRGWKWGDPAHDASVDIDAMEALEAVVVKVSALLPQEGSQ